VTRRQFVAGAAQVGEFVLSASYLLGDDVLRTLRLPEVVRLAAQADHGSGGGEVLQGRGDGRR
jgi:hypothetical protein